MAKPDNRRKMLWEAIRLYTNASEHWVTCETEFNSDEPINLLSAAHAELTRVINKLLPDG